MTKDEEMNGFEIFLMVCVILICITGVFLGINSIIKEHKLLDEFCKSKGYDEHTEHHISYDYQYHKTYNIECDSKKIYYDCEKSNYCIGYDKWRDCIGYKDEMIC